jgi:hypothetical protein
MPEAKGIIRYETPEVFESLTKEWTAAKTPRRSRRKSALGEIPQAPSEG